MKKFLFTTLAMLVSNPSFPDSSYTGKIIKIHTNPNYERVFLTLDGSADDQASCKTNSAYNYVFDATTAGGKNAFSMALAAYASGKPVFIGGYQSCNIYSGVEDLKWLRLQ